MQRAPHAQRRLRAGVACRAAAEGKASSPAVYLLGCAFFIPSPSPRLAPAGPYSCSATVLQQPSPQLPQLNWAPQSPSSQDVELARRSALVKLKQGDVDGATRLLYDGAQPAAAPIF